MKFFLPHLLCFLLENEVVEKISSYRQVHNLRPEKRYNPLSLTKVHGQWSICIESTLCSKKFENICYILLWSCWMLLQLLQLIKWIGCPCTDDVKHGMRQLNKMKVTLHNQQTLGSRLSYLPYLQIHCKMILPTFNVYLVQLPFSGDVHGAEPYFECHFRH